MFERKQTVGKVSIPACYVSPLSSDREIGVDLTIGSAKVKTLFVPSTRVSPTEDIIVVNPVTGIIGIADGMSAPYGSGVPPKFDFLKRGVGLSMGQVLSGIFANRLLKAAVDEDLIDLIKSINTEVSEFHLSNGVSLNDPGNLGGIKSGIVRVQKDDTIAICWGDTFLAFEFTNGDIVASDNQLYWHDKKGIEGSLS